MMTGRGGIKLTTSIQTWRAWLIIAVFVDHVGGAIARSEILESLQYRVRGGKYYFVHPEDKLQYCARDLDGVGNGFMNGVISPTTECQLYLGGG